MIYAAQQTIIQLNCQSKILFADKKLIFFIASFHYVLTTYIATTKKIENKNLSILFCSNNSILK